MLSVFSLDFAGNSGVSLVVGGFRHDLLVLAPRRSFRAEARSHPLRQFPMLVINAGNQYYVK